MCLLVVASRVAADPLVVGANRDERTDRPATAVTVLRAADPRVLGGRDLVAGGTWLAVNEHGVVAGLTNRPLPDGRDPTKRSRGVLPLLAAARHSAEASVAALLDEVDPAEFNPAWLLVGDRSSLFAVSVDGDRPVVEPLPPGVHVLENHPPGARSAKVAHVRRLLGPPAGRWPTDELAERLRRVLADHTRPDPLPEGRPPFLTSACVHGDEYGTRSSALVTVPADPSLRPSLAVADGPPCTAPFLPADELWQPERTAAARG
ncbi:MAG: NRDE family protein [Acidimicrobiales bacterium]